MTDDRIPWAKSGGLKLGRASEHIAVLEAEITAFNAREPYMVIAESEIQTRAIVQRVRIREQPPLRLALIAGDAVHNLRATLDILVHELVLSNGGVPRRQTAFPIRDTSDDFDRDYRRLLNGVSGNAIEMIRALKPYRLGNETLWLLHQLDILDKHKVIVPAFSRVGTTYFDFNAWPRSQSDTIALSWPAEERAQFLANIQEEFLIGINWADPLCPVTDGAELARIEGKEVGVGDMTPRFKFEIAFGVEPAVGKEMVPTLYAFRDTVDAITGQLVPLLA